MTRYLLDTNHIGEALNQVSVVRDRMQQLHRAGDVFGVCGPVLSELMVGVVRRKDAEDCRRRLARLLKLVRLWPVDLAIAERYAEVYHELRSAGRALSQTDITLAAMSRHFDATILTSDADFDGLSGIRLENWLSLNK